MRVFALVLASAGYFSVSECLNSCTCEDTSCTCKWPRISLGDEVCRHPADILECNPVISTDLSYDEPRDTSTTVGCKCSTELCTCVWNEVNKEDEICLNTSEGLLCNDVEMKTTRGNRTRRSRANHACTCNGYECDCDLKKARGANKICLDTGRTRFCVSVKRLSRGSTYNAEELLRYCRCDERGCKCRYPNRRYHSRSLSSEQICVQSYEDSDCVPIQGSAGKTANNYECRCHDEECYCEFKKTTGDEEICLFKDATTSCAPLRKLNSSMGRAYTFSELQKYCICEGNGCKCKYPDRPKSDRNRHICIRLSPEDNCVPMEDSRIEPDALGRSRNSPCTCDDSECSCDFTGNEMVCLETGTKKSCVPVSDFKNKYSTKEDEIFEHCMLDTGTLHCILPSGVDARQICIQSTRGDDCTQIQPDAQSTTSGSINNVLENYKEYCLCQDFICTCHFPKFQGSGKICLVTVTDRHCVNFTVYTENINLTIVAPKSSKGCACQNTLCICYWKEAGHSDVMCIYTVDGIQCVPVFVAVRQGETEERPWENEEAEDNYPSRNQYVECNDGLCICDLVNTPGRSTQLSDICIKQSDNPQCVPATQQSRGRVSCGCNENKRSCICDWSRVENGDEICVNLPRVTECESVRKTTDSALKRKWTFECGCFFFVICYCYFKYTSRASGRGSTNICVESDTGEDCKPAEQMADISALNGVYCPLKDGYYKCVWNKSENVKEICLKTAEKEICKTPTEEGH